MNEDDYNSLVDEEFSNQLEKAIMEEPKQGKHSVVLIFDNDGQIDGEFLCSEDQCEECLDVKECWDDIKFEMIRTKKLCEFISIPVEVELDSEEIWLSIKDPEKYSGVSDR